MLKEKFISYCGITQEYGIHETIEEAEQELKENFRNPDYTADREDYIEGFIAKIKWTACTHTFHNEKKWNMDRASNRTGR